jgi:hypothetical protein
MNRRKSLIVLGLGVMLVAFGTIAWAACGGSTELSLMATKKHPGASGTAYVSENSLSIKAKGLQPEAIYTVWFVNMKPKKHEAGAGAAPYMFKTDSDGVGTYASSLAEAPFGTWEMIMVVLHPDGDPTNMKSMVGALSAEIPKTH